MIKTAETYHVPVLLKESVDGLNIQPGGIYVDVTFGGGGHSREILSRLSEGAHLYSFDQDADAERNVVANPELHLRMLQLQIPEKLDALLWRGRTRRTASRPRRIEPSLR